MSKKKDIESILDECLDRLMFNDETLEECLRDYPEHADELKPLLEAALVTSRVSALEPSTEFREKARIQMYSELQGLEPKKSRWSFFRFSLQPRWVTVVAVVLALFLATGGTAAAASGSMPDDFLYPVKRATEQVQLTFTFTTLGKAEFHARMADRRVEEIVYLANEDKTEKIEMLANNLNTNLTEIAALTSPQDTAAVTLEEGAVMQAGEAAAVMEEAEYEDSEGTEESVLSARAPELEEENGAEEAAPGAAVTAKEFKALEKADVEAETAGQVTPAPAVTAEKATGIEAATDQQKQKGQNGKDEEVRGNDRRARLNITVINQADKNISRLRNLLDVVPESDKPIIQRAIDISEAGYEKAIESLE